MKYQQKLKCNNCKLRIKSSRISEPICECQDCGNKIQKEIGTPLIGTAISKIGDNEYKLQNGDITEIHAGWDKVQEELNQREQKCLEIKKKSQEQSA